MIVVISQTTEERNAELNNKWEEYRELYYNTDLFSKEILKKIGVRPESSIHKYIRERLRNGEVPSSLRAYRIRRGEWLE